MMLYVIPKTDVDGKVERVTGRGFELAGADVSAKGHTLGMNLLPEEKMGCWEGLSPSAYRTD